MKLEGLSRWVEIAANVGVIITLVLLVTEVRTNTLSLQRQAFADRSAALNAPFFENPDLARILASIKEVDSWEQNQYPGAFVGRYGMAVEDAITWGRHLGMIWAGLEADYLFDGPSAGLERRVQLLLQTPDNQLWWEAGSNSISDEAFRLYVTELRN